ncbi:unknown [Alistipes sp. CAG:268]|nr:unknown [Alistipes sp. CAG:268]
MASNGMLVVMIEASTGEVSPTPKMKHPWLKTMARSDAPKSFIRSRGGTCSGF